MAMAAFREDNFESSSGVPAGFTHITSQASGYSLSTATPATAASGLPSLGTRALKAALTSGSSVAGGVSYDWYRDLTLSIPSTYISPYAPAVTTGNTLYTSGAVSFSATTTGATQASYFGSLGKFSSYSISEDYSVVEEVDTSFTDNPVQYTDVDGVVEYFQTFSVSRRCNHRGITLKVTNTSTSSSAPVPLLLRGVSNGEPTGTYYGNSQSVAISGSFTGEVRFDWNLVLEPGTYAWTFGAPSTVCLHGSSGYSSGVGGRAIYETGSGGYIYQQGTWGASTALVSQTSYGLVSGEYAPNDTTAMWQGFTVSTPVKVTSISFAVKSVGGSSELWAGLYYAGFTWSADNMIASTTTMGLRQGTMPSYVFPAGPLQLNIYASGSRNVQFGYTSANPIPSNSKLGTTKDIGFEITGHPTVPVDWYFKSHVKYPGGIKCSTGEQDIPLWIADYTSPSTIELYPQQQRGVTSAAITLAIDTSYKFELWYRVDSQRYKIKVNGQERDNGGAWYDSASHVGREPGNMKIVAALYSLGFTNTDIKNSSASVMVDNWGTYYDTSQNLGVYTIPETGPGRGGWFLEEPQVYLERNGVTDEELTYFYSLGNISTSDYYLAASSGVMAVGVNTTQIFSTQLTDYSDIEDLYVWYSSDGVNYTRYDFPVKFAKEAPTYESIRISDSIESTNLSGFTSLNGVFTLTGVKFGSSEPGKTKFKPASIKLFMGAGLPIAQYTFGSTYDQWAGLGLDTLPPYHFTRYSYSTDAKAVGDSNEDVPSMPIVEQPFSRRFGLTTDGFISPSEDHTAENLSYDVHFSFESENLPARLQDNGKYTTFYAQLENELGITTVTDGVELKLATAKPVLDRVSCSSFQASSGSIMGTFNRTDIDRVEYSLEGRVPLLNVRFSGNSTLSTDNVPPESSSGVTFGYGPFSASTTNNSAALLTNSTWLAYPSRYINIDEGTIELRFRPQQDPGEEPPDTETSIVQDQRYLFDYASDINDLNHNRISMTLERDGEEYFLKGTIYGAIGQDIYEASASIGVSTATSGAPQVGFTDLAMKWKLNSNERSFVSVHVNGATSGTGFGEESGVTIPFKLIPTASYPYTDTESLNAMTVNSSTPLVIGNSLEMEDGATLGATGYISDLRISDVARDDLSYGRTTPSSWSEVGVEFSQDTGVFSLLVEGLADDEIRVYKIRAVGQGGKVLPSGYFNTSICKPVLMRGPYSGVNRRSDTVYTWRLIDAHGVFPEYQFEINPSSLEFQGNDSRMAVQTSINGKQIIRVGPRLLDTLAFGWGQLTKARLAPLMERSDSGHSFFLVDHNDVVYYGKFSLTRVQEIVATVPSKYQVDARFIGQGGYYDYSMVPAI